MNPTEITTQTYNAYATDYAEKWFNLNLDEQLTQFNTYLKPNSLILDLGTGPGRDILALQKLGHRVIGLDRSAGMLKEAAKRGIGPLIQADMRQLPFARHSFQGIWAFDSLFHLSKADLLPTLSKLYQTLHHGHLYLSLKEHAKGEAVEAWFDTKKHGQRFFAFYTHPKLN